MEFDEIGQSVSGVHGYFVLVALYNYIYAFVGFILIIFSVKQQRSTQWSQPHEPHKQ